MEFTKKHLNQILRDETYVHLDWVNMHSGPRYTMIFKEGDTLYRTMFLMDRKDAARWWSRHNSTVVDCEEVVEHTKLVEVVEYVPVPTDIVEPEVTRNMAHDFHL